MDRIKVAFEQVVAALTRDPALGRSTGTTTVRVRDGVVCDIEAGPWRLVADLPVAAGGTASAPTPGVYGRAALGSCLAMGYAMRLARHGLAVHSLEVEVQADYDDAALYGLSHDPPGYSEVRYTVTIASDAPEAELLRAIDEADDRCPYLDVFRRSQRCTRAVHLRPAP